MGKNMNKLKHLIAVLLLAPAFALAAGAEIKLDRAPIDENDQASLQRGARHFVNYCLNCHSASYMRFNRLRDIGLTDQQIVDNLVFTNAKVGDLMKIAMDPKDAASWFGAAPPELSVIARSRASHAGTGADWLYSYLRSFYRDAERPTGWNNTVFPNVGMPHVLWELQGEREPQFDTVMSHGHETQVFKGWKQITPGTLTPAQYDQSIANLVGYLQWMGEPGQNTRVRIGVWVLLFLGVFTVIAWRLNAAFWKNVR